MWAFPEVGTGSEWWVSAEERVIDALACGSCRSDDLLRRSCVHKRSWWGWCCGGEGVAGS